METMIINDLLIQILAGVIIAAIVGAAGSMFVLYKCIHNTSQTTKQLKKAMTVILKLQVEDTKMHHPESKHIAELDEIFKELTE